MKCCAWRRQHRLCWPWLMRGRSCSSASSVTALPRYGSNSSNIGARLRGSRGWVRSQAMSRQSQYMLQELAICLGTRIRCGQCVSRSRRVPSGGSNRLPRPARPFLGTYKYGRNGEPWAFQLPVSRRRTDPFCHTNACIVVRAFDCANIWAHTKHEPMRSLASPAIMFPSRIAWRATNTTIRSPERSST